MLHREIDRRLNISHHIVFSFLTRFDLRQSIENLLRPEASQKLSESDKCYIIHTAKLNTRIPLAELQANFQPSISHQTIQRHLQENDIHKWLAKGCTRLKPEYKKAWDQWACKYQHWDWTGNE